MTEQIEDSGLIVTLDADAVELILLGLALLPYGRVKPLYEALQLAAKDAWDIKEKTYE